MSISAIGSGFPGGVDLSRLTAPTAERDGTFTRLVQQALDKIAGPARAAEQAVNDLASGKTDNIHQVLLAVAQADLAFRLGLEIRNKLTEAYQEIQRMQV